MSDFVRVWNYLVCQPVLVEIHNVYTLSTYLKPRRNVFIIPNEVVLSRRPRKVVQWATQYVSERRVVDVPITETFALTSVIYVILSWSRNSKCPIKLAVLQ